MFGVGGSRSYACTGRKGLPVYLYLMYVCVVCMYGVQGYDVMKPNTQVKKDTHLYPRPPKDMGYV